MKLAHTKKLVIMPYCGNSWPDTDSKMRSKTDLRGCSRVSLTRRRLLDLYWGGKTCWQVLTPKLIDCWKFLTHQVTQTWWSSFTPCYYQPLVALHYHLHPRSLFQTVLSAPTFISTLTGKLSKIQHKGVCQYLLSCQLWTSPRNNSLILEITSTNKPLSRRTWLSLPKIHLSSERISKMSSTPTVLGEILCGSGQRRRSPNMLLCKCQ